MPIRVLDWNDTFMHLNGELPNQFLAPTVYYTLDSSDLDSVDDTARLAAAPGAGGQSQRAAP